MSQLGNRLRDHAREQPGARAVYARDRWWTYAELVSAAETLAGELDVTSGDVVAIAIARGIEAVLAVCAAALVDAVPAMIDPEDAELAQRTLEKLCPTIVIDARTLQLVGDVPVLARGEPPPWQPIARPGLAFVIYTSGSTVDAKGVAWSEVRAAHDWRASPPTEAQRAAPSGVAVPLCTALGLQDVLRTLHDGLSTVLLDVPFRVGLEQARALGVRRLRLTPTHVDVLLATTTELPDLRAAVVASAPIAPERLRALAERLPGARIGRSYGLTESGAATMLWIHSSPKRLHTVGRPIASRRISIRDADGRELPPRTWGEVVIELPAWDVHDGYLDAPQELARRFERAVVHTGDRGKLDGRGFLVLGARAAEILKVGGRSVSAPHIEHVLRGSELAVIGVPDRTLGEVPCAVYVPPFALGDATSALRADEVPRWYLPRSTLPRGASGKVRRGRLALEAGRWVTAFPQVVAPDHRTYAAYALDPRTSIVDGGLAPWFGELPSSAGRVIALVARRPVRVLALAYLQALGACRFVAGPFAVAQPDGEVTGELLHVFAGELLRLVALLPGAKARLIYARHAAAGFTPVRDGWLARGDDDLHAQADAAADDVARAARAVQQLCEPGS